MLMFVLVVATLVSIYWFWIRPILKSRPAFRELYEQEESFFAALREKFAGIKQKLSSAIVMVASAAVSGYDFFAPIVSGVDVSSIAAKVPSWAWPLILISTTAIFQFLRNLADRRHKSELAEVAATGQGG
jgi:hypothetical protein